MRPDEDETEVALIADAVFGVDAEGSPVKVEEVLRYRQLRAARNSPT